MRLKLTGRSKDSRPLEQRLINWRDHLAPELASIYYYHFRGVRHARAPLLTERAAGLLQLFIRHCAIANGQEKPAVELAVHMGDCYSRVREMVESSKDKFHFDLIPPARVVEVRWRSSGRGALNMRSLREASPFMASFSTTR
jgi:hypothetical protein